ncbi:amidase [Geosmithia morbida]|uniref:Amidase n=1 Tax=Geosmithia morbida TaxID=1094350 RepID=A0A9P4YV22_9HYPO|nr:amidase [Geosmithia morbida]KAF4122319.1 amidase [Geosmithia morbida]
MSVFFKDISGTATRTDREQSDNPVRAGDVKKTLESLGLSVRPEESAEYTTLLAAVHDCAERISNLPDYQPVPDTQRFPRKDVRIPDESEQLYGHAWAHKFTISGEKEAEILGSKTVCIKDCIAVAGVPQFFGSDAFDPWTPTTDATVVTRCLEAGASILGTANCEHFCNSTASFTSAQGVVHNPLKTGYSAGGSTSGGVALVAGGHVDIALGTDQGGSIRVPSSLCGCVGFKPTHGLVPYTGITSGDPIDDHAGPIARSIDDIAACMDAIAGDDGIDDRSLGAGDRASFHFRSHVQDADGRMDGVRIAVLKEGIENELVQPGVATAFHEAVQRLKDVGAVIEPISVPLHKEGPSVWTVQQRISGAAGIMGRASGRRGLYLTEFEKTRLPWTQARFDKLFHSTKNTVINGLYLTERFPGLYGKTVNIGRRIADAYETVLRDYDAVVMPTTPFVAPRHGTRDSVIASFEPSMGMTTNTAVFNITGHPALTLPVGWSAAPDDETLLLPVGLQIVGGLGQDARVLQLARNVEKRIGWTGVPPTVDDVKRRR